MDASLNHDPYAPDAAPVPLPFDEDVVNRWRRVGATDDEIRALGDSLDLPSVDDAALVAKLDEYRAEHQADETDEGDDTDKAPVVTEDEAIEGPWTDADPIEIDGVSYPSWTLGGGWVAILVGDGHNGIHLVGYGVEGVTEKVRSQIHSTAAVVAAEQAHADTTAWQSAKHLADAKARATT